MIAAKRAFIYILSGIFISLGNASIGGASENERVKALIKAATEKFMATQIFLEANEFDGSVQELVQKEKISQFGNWDAYNFLVRRDDSLAPGFFNMTITFYVSVENGKYRPVLRENKGDKGFVAAYPFHDRLILLWKSGHCFDVDVYAVNSSSQRLAKIFNKFSVGRRRPRVIEECLITYESEKKEEETTTYRWQGGAYERK